MTALWTQIRPYVLGLLAVGVVALGISTYKAIEAKGALTVLLAQNDSAHKADSVVSVKTSSAALSASQTADSLRAILRMHQGADKAAGVKAESAVVHLRSGRDSLLAVLADHQVSDSVVREQSRAYVVRTDSTVGALQAALSSKTSLLVMAYAVIASDSTAIQRGIAATNAATKRALDAEQGEALLRKTIPSQISTWGVRLLAAGAGYAVGRVR